MASSTSESREAFPLDRIQRVAEFRAQLRAFVGHSDDIARRWELTPQRYLLLLMIVGAADGTGRLSLGEIADRLRLSPNTATELVTRTEALGLVQRTQAEHDQRVSYVSASPEGRRRLLGALADNDRSRDELNAAFARMSRSYRKT